MEPGIVFCSSYVADLEISVNVCYWCDKKITASKSINIEMFWSFCCISMIGFIALLQSICHLTANYIPQILWTDYITLVCAFWTFHSRCSLPFAVIIISILLRRFYIDRVWLCGCGNSVTRTLVRSGIGVGWGGLVPIHSNGVQFVTQDLLQLSHTSHVFMALNLCSETLVHWYITGI